MPIKLPKFGDIAINSTKNLRTNILQDAAERRKERAEEREEQAELRKEEMHAATLTAIEGQNFSRIQQQNKMQLQADTQKSVADIGKSYHEISAANAKSKNPKAQTEINYEHYKNNAGTLAISVEDSIEGMNKAQKDELERVVTLGNGDPMAVSKAFNSSWLSKYGSMDFNPTTKKVAIMWQGKEIPLEDAKVLADIEKTKADIEYKKKQTEQLGQPKPISELDTKQKQLENQKLEKEINKSNQAVKEGKTLSPDQILKINKRITELGILLNAEMPGSKDASFYQQEINSAVQILDDNERNKATNKKDIKSDKKITREMAQEYVNKYGKEEGRRKAKEDGYKF